MNRKASDRLRALCLALPQAVEVEGWGYPTYRVRGRMFALERHAEGGRMSVWCKAPEGGQAHLVAADPERFFAPPYLGPKGWIAMGLDRRPDWDEVARLVTRSYRLVAPKRLARSLTF